MNCTCDRKHHHTSKTGRRFHFIPAPGTDGRELLKRLIACSGRAKALPGPFNPRKR